MNTRRKKGTQNSFKENLEMNNAINSLIKPFKEMPPLNGIEKESADRITAHELFSFYTADIIKNDIYFNM